MEEKRYRLSHLRRSFSLIGFAFSLLIAVAFAVQLAFVVVSRRLGFGGLKNQSWWSWVCIAVSMYLFAFPACFLLLRKLPAEPPEKHSLTVKQFLTLIPICFCLMYGGNLLGNWLSGILSGGNAVNSLDSYVMDTGFLKILVMVLLAPLLEELICRKLVLDRIACYGEKISVLMSGLIFGLLHQNLFQFFYAFALGCLFGYVYIRTGRIRYTIILHTMINFLGAVVAPALINMLSSDAMTVIMSEPDAANLTTEIMMEAAPALLVLSLYSTALIVLSVLGLALLIIKYRQLTWKEPPLPFSLALRGSFLNFGMIFYSLICLTATLLDLFNK
jgi:membrane protease YdiL (CAAX protease family)